MSNPQLGELRYKIYPNVGRFLDEDTRSVVSGSTREEAIARAAARIAFDTATCVRIAAATVRESNNPGTDGDDAEDWLDEDSAPWRVDLVRAGTNEQRRIRARHRRRIDDAYVLREAASELSPDVADGRDIGQLCLPRGWKRAVDDCQDFAKIDRRDHEHVLDAVQLVAREILTANQDVVSRIEGALAKANELGSRQMRSILETTQHRDFAAAFRDALART